MFKRCYSIEAISKTLVAEKVARINESGKVPWNLLQLEDNGKIQSKLRAEYTLKNYPSTWEFLNSIALAAHKTRHHPEITTVYNKVTIELTTHDIDNNISQLDLDLASNISQIYSKYEPSRKVKFTDFLSLTFVE